MAESPHLVARGQPAPAATVIVMRTDDNGNDVEVKRVATHAEAEALVRDYEARAHKQTYWIAER